MNQPNNTKKEILEEFNSLPEWWDLPKEVRHGEVGDKFTAFLAHALDRIEAEGRRMEREEIARQINNISPVIENVGSEFSTPRHYRLEGYAQAANDIINLLESKKEPQQEQ